MIPIIDPLSRLVKSPEHVCTLCKSTFPTEDGALYMKRREDGVVDMFAACKECRSILDTLE